MDCRCCALVLIVGRDQQQEDIRVIIVLVLHYLLIHIELQLKKIIMAQHEKRRPEWILFSQLMILYRFIEITHVSRTISYHVHSRTD